MIMLLTRLLGMMGMSSVTRRIVVVLVMTRLPVSVTSWAMVVVTSTENAAW